MTADVSAAGRSLWRRRGHPDSLVGSAWKKVQRLAVAGRELLDRLPRRRTSMPEVRTGELPRERLPAEIRVLVGAEFVVAVGYGIVAPALPEFARSFDVGVAAASAVVSGFAVFRLLFAPVAGRLLHRLGERRVFSCGVLVVALSSAACAFAADYDQLLAFRAVGGVGSTMFTVAATALLIKLSPSHMRGRAAAASATGFLLGTIAGPLIGGGLIVVDIRAPFLIYAGLLGSAAMTILFVLRGRESEEEPVADEVPAMVTFVDAVRDPVFRACLASNFLTGWTVYGIRITLVPLFVVDLLGRSSGWSGVALTAFALGTVATLTIGGRLADGWDRQQCAVTGSVVVAITTILLSFTSSPVEVLATCVLSGMGTGLVAPPESAAVADVLAPQGEDVRSGGPALAGYQMCGDVGAIVGPVLAGLAVDLGGYTAAFTLTAALAGGSAWSWRQASGRRPDTGNAGVITPVLDPIGVRWHQAAVSTLLRSWIRCMRVLAGQGRSPGCGWLRALTLGRVRTIRTPTKSVTALDTK